MLGQVEHILRNFHVLDVVDVFLLVADFVGLADQRPHEAFARKRNPGYSFRAGPPSPFRWCLGKKRPHPEWGKLDGASRRHVTVETLISTKVAPSPTRHAGVARALRSYRVSDVLFVSGLSHQSVTFRRQKTGQPEPAGLPPRSRSSARALHGTDLSEHCQHIEVVRATLDLAAFDADDLTCRHLDRLVGWRDGTGWRLQWAGVNAFPNDLQDRGITARKLADECGFGVGEGARPALPCLDDLTSALDPTVGSLFVVHSIRSQQFLRLAPILIVVCGNSGLRDFDDIRHDAILSRGSDGGKNAASGFLLNRGSIALEGRHTCSGGLSCIVAARVQREQALRTRHYHWRVHEAEQYWPSPFEEKPADNRDPSSSGRKMKVLLPSCDTFSERF